MNVACQPYPRSAIRTTNRPNGWREAAFVEQISLEHGRRREAARMRLAVLAGVALGIAGVGLSHFDTFATLANYIIGQTAS